MIHSRALKTFAFAILLSPSLGFAQLEADVVLKPVDPSCQVVTAHVSNPITWSNMPMTIGVGSRTYSIDSKYRGEESEAWAYKASTGEILNIEAAGSAFERVSIEATWGLPCGLYKGEIVWPQTIEYRLSGREAVLALKETLRKTFGLAKQMKGLPNANVFSPDCTITVGDVTDRKEWLPDGVILDVQEDDGYGIDLSADIDHADHALAVQDNTGFTFTDGTRKLYIPHVSNPKRFEVWGDPAFSAASIQCRLN